MRRLTIIRAWWLRRRLASLTADIEVIERGRAVMAADLDRLIRAAVATRAELWHLENPHPPGRWLGSLNAPIKRRAELRRINTGRTA